MKRIILKINASGSIEAFTSLKKFFDIYTSELKFKANIETYLSRKKEDYVSTEYTLKRIEVK